MPRRQRRGNTIDIETTVEDLLKDAPDEVTFTFHGPPYRGKPRAKGTVMGPACLDVRLSRRIGHGATDAETGEWDKPLHEEAMLLEWLTHPRTEWNGVTLDGMPLMRSKEAANEAFNLAELDDLAVQLWKYLYPELYLLIYAPASAEGEADAAPEEEGPPTDLAPELVAIPPSTDTKSESVSATTNGATDSKASSRAQKV